MYIHGIKSAVPGFYLDAVQNEISARSEHWQLATLSKNHQYLIHQ